jgi:hypothetical protein
MNHFKMTLTITAIVAAAALATVAFAVPQHVMAYRHHHHHNDNHKSIKVDQQSNQENQCSGQLHVEHLEHHHNLAQFVSTKETTTQ